MPSLKSFRSRFAALALLAAASCVGGGAGQSGSEFIPPPKEPMSPMAPLIPHCPCDSFRNSRPIRATVVSLEAFPAVGRTRYELIANELLGPDPEGKNELIVSSHFGGYWDGMLGCGGRSSAQFAPGDEVLAFYRRGTQDSTACCEYFACETPCERESGQDAKQPPELEACRKACVASTQAACSQHQPEAVLRGQLQLIPWASELVVGSSEAAVVSIRRDQLGSLQKDRAQCRAEIDDLFGTLHPSAAAAGSGEGAGIDTDGAADPQAGSPAPTPLPTSPPCCKGSPGPVAGGGAQPPNGATNTASESSGPPRGPEDPSVRCAGQ